jgi:hypothetical protein
VISKLFSYYQMVRSFEVDRHQRLAWEDAEKARIARDKSIETAKEKAQAMLDANPSGQLGRSKLDDEAALKRAGLL